jgi:hypothetical protein
MDLGLAFTFVFQDKEWVKKILLAAVISLIPVVGQVVLLGWLIETARRVIREDPVPLPPFTDFGGLLMLGIKAFVVGLVFSLPIIIVAIPYAVVTSAVDPQEMSGLITAVSICFSCFALIYSLILAFLYPAAFGVLAASDQIGAALNPGRLFGLIKAAPGAYILAILGMIVGSIIASLGVVLCVIGVLATAAYYYPLQGHLFGQAYKAALAGGASAPAVAEIPPTS